MEKKVRQAESSFKELAAAKQRKAEKKAHRLAERKAAAASELDGAQEALQPTTNEAQVILQQATKLIEASDANAGTEGAPIDILVHCMTGEEFWLTPWLETSVAELKNMLSEVWGIPSVCQQLLVNCTQLHDSELLWHHMKDGDHTMSCTALVVLGEAREPAILAKLAVGGPEGILNTILDVLGSKDDGTLYELFIELRKIAKQGKERAIAVLIEVMNRATLPSIIAAILHDLAYLGSHCEHVQRAVIAQMQQPDVSVRVAALEAVFCFAGNISRTSIHTVSKCLEDEHEQVRFQAVQVLADIAAKGNADDVAWEVEMRLGHKSGGIRRAAVQALSHIIAQGGEQTVCADNILVKLVADCDPDVRAAAVQAIDTVAALHSQQTFEALVAVLFDPDWHVRQLAVRALKRFPQKDIGLLVLSATPYLGHADAMMRLTAVEALSTVIDHSVNKAVASDLKHLLSDNDVLVRSTVASVLCDFPWWQ